MSLRPATREEALARAKQAEERRRERHAKKPYRGLGRGQVGNGKPRSKLARTLDAAVPTSPAAPVQVTTDRTPGQAAEKRARWRSRAYLDLVKRDPCEACLDVGQRQSAHDPHHVRVRGNRDDTCDWLVIPLCRRCHDDAHAGRIPTDYLRGLLAGYLCRKLLNMGRGEAGAVLDEMRERLGE